MEITSRHGCRSRLFRNMEAMEAQVWIAGSASSGQLGHAVSNTGDLNGDRSRCRRQRALIVRVLLALPTSYSVETLHSNCLSVRVLPDAPDAWRGGDGSEGLSLPLISEVYPMP
jgi:hypothetical protein